MHVEYCGETINQLLILPLKFNSFIEEQISQVSDVRIYERMWTQSYMSKAGEMLKDDEGRKGNIWTWGDERTLEGIEGEVGT